jgi:hypothetical protein
MKTILFTTLTLSALSLGTLAPAIAQTCYNDSNTIIDLGTLCREHRQAPTPVTGQPATGQTTAQRTARLFPDWILNPAQRQTRPQRTAHGDNYGRWIYEERYIMTTEDWPYTTDPTARYERTFVDCRTLAIGQQYQPFVGSSGYWERSIDQAFNPQRAREIYGALCRNEGL